MLKQSKILMKFLFYGGIVSISDWKHTKSVGIKNQVFCAGPCSYNEVKLRGLISPA